MAVKARICEAIQSLDGLAASVGFGVDRGMLGEFIVRDMRNKSFIMRSFDEDEVRTFLGKISRKDFTDLDDALNFPARGVTLQPYRIRPSDQLTPFRQKIAALSTGFLSKATPIKQLAQNVENLTGIPVSKVYNKTQAARQMIHQELAVIKRDGLKALGRGGKQTDLSFNEAQRQLASMEAKLSPRERQLSTIYREVYSKDEVARAGTIINRDMTPEEIQIAKNLMEWGVADEVPTIVRRVAVIQSFLKNREEALTRLPRLRNDILEGRAPAGLAVELDAIEAAAGDIDTFEKALKAIGLSENEANATREINRLVTTKSAETVNLPVIYRYATAPTVGRAQWAKQVGLSKEAIAVSDYRDTILREAFKDSGGFNHEQLIYGQLPIFRQFIDVGLYPGKQFALSADNQAAAVLNHLDEGSKFFSPGVLSGHLNPYELSPSATTVKHIENVYQRKHLHPIMGEARDTVKKLAEFDKGAGGRSRVAQFFSEYLNDIEGRPSKKFQEANDSFRTIGRMLGINVPDRVAERVTGMLVRLSSNSTIPFRPALIVRNMYQSPAFTAPVMGPEAWWHGVKASIGWTGNGFSIEAKKEAIERAIKAGAIDPNVLPIHASSEVFGPVGARLGLGHPLLEQAKLSASDLFDLGFTFYRKPDDWGRVVAFEAGRFRVNKHLKDYLRTRDLERFKELAKVKTFNETIEAEFERLVRMDLYDDAATLIGKEMADEAHFLYANANHPPGWNSVPGRLFGQFGTFPVQYAQFVMEKMTRGTLTDRAEFLFIHSALNMGVVVAGAEVFGADLGSWSTFGSLTYTGGPYADAAISMIQLVGGSDTEKAFAKRNLQMMLPTFDSPESVALPGSYFLGDLVDAYQQNDLIKMFGEASGVRFLKPNEENWVEKAYGWVDEIIR